MFRSEKKDFALTALLVGLAEIILLMIVTKVRQPLEGMLSTFDSAKISLIIFA